MDRASTGSHPGRPSDPETRSGPETRSDPGARSDPEARSHPAARSDPAARFEAALAAHRDTIDELAGLEAVVVAAAGLILERVRDGATIFWIGNGGSAADSQHLAAELVGRFEGVDRPGLRSFALTTDTSVLTSVANDLGFERVFARQIEAVCRPGDVVIALSTSGRSGNVVAAVRAGVDARALTIALSGGDGGPLADAADVAIVVPGTSPARIQEAHILLGHFLCEAIHEGLSAG